MKKLLAMLLVLCMLPVLAMAEEGMPCPFKVTGGVEDDHWHWNPYGGILMIASDELLSEGVEPAKLTVSMADGIEIATASILLLEGADVTLDGVKIVRTNGDGLPPIAAVSLANEKAVSVLNVPQVRKTRSSSDESVITLAKGSINVVVGGMGYSAVYNEKEIPMRINGTGSLEALGLLGAGIGGGAEMLSGVVEMPGKLTIDSGNITALGLGGAGIGGGVGQPGNVTINGGNITAFGIAGAGIGGGMSYEGLGGMSPQSLMDADEPVDELTNVTITGGTIKAYSLDVAKNGGETGSIPIIGGTGIGGAGIGGGMGGDAKVTISGGNITAEGMFEGTEKDLMEYFSGIRGIIDTMPSAMNVSEPLALLNEDGDEDEYRRQPGGAGIGGGANGDGIVTISGGTITAFGSAGDEENGLGGAGIGGGVYGDGHVTITGGTVKLAKGGYFAAGIGGGDFWGNGIVTISGDAVIREARAGANGGAGIGGGWGGMGDVHIDGAQIDLAQGDTIDLGAVVVPGDGEAILPGDGPVILSGEGAVVVPGAGEAVVPGAGTFVVPGVGNGFSYGGMEPVMMAAYDLRGGNAGRPMRRAMQPMMLMAYDEEGGEEPEAGVTIVNAAAEVSENGKGWKALNGGLPYTSDTDITADTESFEFFRTANATGSVNLPGTGDVSMLGAWIALLGAAGMGLKLRKKQN